MNYCIFDLSTLHYGVVQTDEGAVVVLQAATGETLATAQSASAHPSAVWAAGFTATQAALESGSVLRENEDGSSIPCRIAFYDPLSTMVSVGPSPDTAIYAPREPLVMSTEGVVAVIHNQTMTVASSGSVLSFQESTPELTSRMAGMHPSPPTS